MKKLLFLVLISIAIFPTSQAQVTIGMGDAPVGGALLQLKETSDPNANSKKGLMLPRVALNSLTGDLASTLGATPNEYDSQEHVGMVVYNIAENAQATNRRCPGIHVWVNDRWEPVIPYPPMVREEVFVKLTNGVFTFLNPNEPNNEGWKRVDKIAGNYPLGPFPADKRLKDADNNLYYITRYYVGYFTLTAQYTIKESYSCDKNNPVFEEKTEYRITDTFEDGVWMSQNLRVKQYDSERDNDESTVNLSAKAIGIDTSVEDLYLAKYTFPSGLESNAATMGALYNWAAATNGKGGDLGTAGGYELDISGGQGVQGICPKGWHLPTSRQWTDLENGIIRNTHLFAASVDLGTTNLGYTATGGRGVHSPALRSTKSGSGANKGLSFTADKGGFDAYDSGLVSGVGAIWFNQTATWWTSSSYNQEAARRVVYNGVLTADWASPIKVTSSTYARHQFYSVRCMRNTD